MIHYAIQTHLSWLKISWWLLCLSYYKNTTVSDGFQLEDLLEIISTACVLRLKQTAILDSNQYEDAEPSYIIRDAS